RMSNGWVLLGWLMMAMASAWAALVIVRPLSRVLTGRYAFESLGYGDAGRFGIPGATMGPPSRSRRQPPQWGRGRLERPPGWLVVRPPRVVEPRPGPVASRPGEAAGRWSR